MVAVLATGFNRASRDLLKGPVLERKDANCGDVLPRKTKQCSLGIHSSTQLTPIQASSKTYEGYNYQKLLDKRWKKKPKFKLHDLVG